MKLVVYIAILFCSVHLFGQTKVSSKLYAKDLKLANAAFEQEDYLNAINFYRKVLTIDLDNETAHLNSVISRLNLNQAPDSSYNHIVKLKNSKTPEVLFYFGKFYHLTSNFEQAIKYYTNYRAIAIKERAITNDDVDYHIACSKNAIDLGIKE